MVTVGPRMLVSSNKTAESEKVGAGMQTAIGEAVAGYVRRDRATGMRENSNGSRECTWE